MAVYYIPEAGDIIEFKLKKGVLIPDPTDPTGVNLNFYEVSESGEVLHGPFVHKHPEEFQTASLMNPSEITQSMLIAIDAIKAVCRC